VSIIKQIKKNIANVPGWRTDKKIVVIESDDWGSISMPSKEIYDHLLAKGVPVDKSAFTRYDCLEGEEDLNELFHVLRSFKDYLGNHPCITACTIVANPDFERIKESGMTEYFYEPFTETYKRYPNHTQSFNIWRKGMESHLLWPQFHGREHLNPYEWLRCLKKSEVAENFAFEGQTLLGLTSPMVSKRRLGYLSAFDFETVEEFGSFEKVLVEGQSLFENLFGFKSLSFVAPTSIRSDRMDKWLFENGIMYHQMGQQVTPFFENYKLVNRMWGQKNAYGQIYWRRNSKFEPSINASYDWVGSVMKDMEVAFRWKKPIVISSHRLNYIGGIVKSNRDTTLKLFENLLKTILKKYPDVQFMSSDQLGMEINRRP
jgi:hypothetical protein